MNEVLRDDTLAIEAVGAVYIFRDVTGRCVITQIDGDCQAYVSFPAHRIGAVIDALLVVKNESEA